MDDAHEVVERPLFGDQTPRTLGEQRVHHLLEAAVGLSVGFALDSNHIHPHQAVHTVQCYAGNLEGQWNVEMCPMGGEGGEGYLRVPGPEVVETEGQEGMPVEDEELSL